VGLWKIGPLLKPMPVCWTPRFGSKAAGRFFYMTWADRSKPETQAALAEAYETISRDLGAMLCPVGLAWQRALRLNRRFNFTMPTVAMPVRRVLILRPACSMR